jgi:hypothetical protein
MDLWRIPSAGGSPEQLTRLSTVITFLTVLDAQTLLYIAPDEAGPGRGSGRSM